VARDLDLLRQGGVPVSRGDARCVTFGDLTRLVVWKLRPEWDRGAAWRTKLATIGRALEGLPSWAAISERLGNGDAGRSDAVEDVEIRF
jgi:hypothetical protein